MTKTQTVGGSHKRVASAHGMPKMVSMPSMPRPPAKEKESKFPSPLERKRKNMEDTAKDARFISWYSQYGGSIYDFIIQDYLTYEKRQTRGSDFLWGTSIGGFPVDYFLPSTQRVWNVRSRSGLPILSVNRFYSPGVEGVVDASMRSVGLSVVALYIENLASDRNNDSSHTLDAAWTGLQVP